MKWPKYHVNWRVLKMLDRWRALSHSKLLAKFFLSKTLFSTILCICEPRDPFWYTLIHMYVLCMCSYLTFRQMKHWNLVLSYRFLKIKFMNRYVQGPDHMLLSFRHVKIKSISALLLFFFQIIFDLVLLHISNIEHHLHSMLRRNIWVLTKIGEYFIVLDIQIRKPI